MKLEFSGPDGRVECAVSVGSKCQQEEEGKKWGHPERIALPTLREEGQLESRRAGQDGRRVRKAV